MFSVRPVGLVKSAFVWRPTISVDVTNWVLYSQAIAAGWDGTTPLDAEVTVGSGIVLSANSTSLYGFDTGTGFPAGTTLKLIMPGYVCGMGGAGGPELQVLRHTLVMACLVGRPCEPSMQSLLMPQAA